MICGDALADVFVNSSPRARRTWRELEASVNYWLAPDARAWIEVPGAKRALRLDGTTYRYSPAEPDRTTIVIALAGDAVVTLTMRGTQRADVQAEMDARSVVQDHGRDAPTPIAVARGRAARSESARSGRRAIGDCEGLKRAFNDIARSRCRIASAVSPVARAIMPA